MVGAWGQAALPVAPSGSRAEREIAKARPSTNRRIENELQQALQDAPGGLMLTELYRRVSGHHAVIQAVLQRRFIDAGKAQAVPHRSGRSGSRATKRYVLNGAERQPAVVDPGRLEQVQFEIVRLLRKADAPLRRRDLLKLVSGGDQLVGAAADQLSRDSRSPVFIGPGGYRYDRPTMIRCLVVKKLLDDGRPMGWKELEAHVGGCRADTSAVIKEMTEAGLLVRRRCAGRVTFAPGGSRQEIAERLPDLDAPQALKPVEVLAAAATLPQPEQLELPQRPAEPPAAPRSSPSLVQPSPAERRARSRVLSRALTWWQKTPRGTQRGAALELWDEVAELVRVATNGEVA